MESTALERIEQPSIALRPEIYLAPPMSVQAAVERMQQFQELVSKLLIPMDPARDGKDFAGADYGILPGTKNRSLFQPGAEKLAMFFGLEVNVYCRSKTEEWGTPQSPGQAFFKYEFEAIAKYNGHTICNVIRSCSTREPKYAWLWVSTRKTPADDEVMEMEQIEAGRWVTDWKTMDFKPRRQEADRIKAEGRGRWRKVGDEFVWQEKTSRVWQEKRPNPDPAGLQFVVEAMAQKRAYVAAVKKALAATGYFASDIDRDDVRDNLQNLQGNTSTEPPVEPKKKAEPIAEERDFSTEFWLKARKAGIKTGNAAVEVTRVQAGEITWQQAIDALPA
ncbi:MAG TPA: hypothetical protein PKD31_15370 [Blastocatellia bacterium]|nr:hypothetical protein [Blastocatellia bacterium]